MNDAQLSKMAGHKQSYLSVVKHDNPEKYRYLKQVGIDGYRRECENLRVKLGEIWYGLEDRGFTRFYRKHLAGVYASPESFTNALRDLAFASAERPFKWTTFHRVKKIVEAWEKETK